MTIALIMANSNFLSTFLYCYNSDLLLISTATIITSTITPELLIDITTVIFTIFLHYYYTIIANSTLDAVIIRLVFKT